ncbi:MAG: hypothetical protein WD708_05795 [Kiritimatiellia bacterium]
MTHSNSFQRKFILLGVLLCAVAPLLPAKPRISVADQDHFNLFNAEEPAAYPVSLRGFPGGGGHVTGHITDFFGNTSTVSEPVTFPDGGGTVSIELGDLPNGYYEVVFEADIGGERAVSKQKSFGVAPLFDRTAAEARELGLRFGLKTFQLSDPGVWWRKDGTVWDLAEGLEATAKLGLHWTRHSMTQDPGPDEPGKVGTLELMENHPMNVIMKVEGYPLREMFDEQRYGPLKEFRKKPASRRSVPLREPYIEWLKQEVAKIPEDQTVFEIGNEVWNYMSAEEFADWAQMALEAIKAARPNALVGVDAGLGTYSQRFMKAGGMEGMDIAFSHPYSFTPLPEHRIRNLIRNHHDIFEYWTGQQHLLHYVTEYGWPVAPEDKGKRSVSEKIQAQRTTRVSLMLYAEDVKALVPHMMADREQDRDNWDQWFGFFRLNGQPMPVVIAHATAARMIDGGEFVGDLWYGPGIGAMLFEREGVHTLALWTLEEDKQVQIDVGVPEITRVNLMGAEQTLKTSGGKIDLALDGSVIYLVGVNPELAAQADPPGSPLRQDRWSRRLDGYVIAKMETAPEIDGDLSDWANADSIRLDPTKADGGAAEVRMGWDEKTVYLSLAVTGQTGDVDQHLDFGLGNRPDRQVDMGGAAIYDYRFIIPSPANKREDLLVVNPLLDGRKMTVPEAGHASGIEWTVTETGNGWTAELAVPRDFLWGTPELKPGGELSGRFLLKQNKETLFSIGEGVASREWPLLKLE